MGLIMLGTADPRVAEEMISYAKDTQHEKIIRGLAVGLALLFYGKQEQADKTAEELLAEKVWISNFSLSITFSYLLNRTRSSATVACTRSLWLMRVHRTTMRSASFCMSPYLIHLTMFGGQQ